MRRYTSGLTIAALAVCSTIALAQEPVGQRDANQQFSKDAKQEAAEKHDAGAESAQKLVTDYFTGKLILMNECTVAMSQLAQQRSSTEEVKQFAEMMAQGHSELNQRLKQMAPEIAAIATIDQQRQRRTAGFRGDPDQSDAEETERQANADKREQKSDRRAKKGDHHAKKGEHAKHGKEGGAVCEILSIEKDAAQNYVQASTQMLEEYQGQDFDMGYLGFQIGGHTWALAQIEAMQSVGDEEFQQFVSETQSTLKQHLAKARQLSQKFEDRESAGNRR